MLGRVLCHGTWIDRARKHGARLSGGVYCCIKLGLTRKQGTIVGSQLCAAMKVAAGAGGVSCQGVGGAYKATLQANTQPKGTNAASIQEAVSVITDAMTQCPQSTMVLAGYR
jgi:hypothetical protein